MARRSNQPILKKSVLGVHWKDWCWSWNSNTLATWSEEMTHLKRSWCWERLKVGRERGDRGFSGWMASPTQWICVWVNSGSWWWIGRPGMLQSMGSQRIGHDWEIELNWRWYNRTTELSIIGFSQSVNQLWTWSSCGMSPHRLQSKCFLFSSPSHVRIHFSPKMSYLALPKEAYFSFWLYM